jgi:hypothetical protein
MNKAPSLFVTALCVGLFYRGLFAELAHAAKTDPYLNYALKTDPYLAHVAVRGFHGPAYGAVRGIVIPPFNR